MQYQVQKHERFPLRNSNDIVVARQRVRTWAAEIGFGIIDQTKIVTAASELARNTLEYGGGGEMLLERLQDVRPGLRLTFEDQGPGIADLNLALTDGYTTGGGLGMGLTGARRLMSDFDIHSKLGEGTRVTVTKWK